jgi:uncharacterized repeat protein (TIGR02543 family)
MPNPTISNYKISGYENANGESFDIWNAITKDEKVFVILSSNNRKLCNLILIFNEGDKIDYKYALERYEEYKLPVPTKVGYTFEGWYDNEEFEGEKYTNVIADGNIILYAKWTKTSSDENPDAGEEDITENEVLDCISDVVNSNTTDYLPSNINGVAVTYTSSDNNLYTIEKGVGHTNRRHQTHWKKTVTVYANLASGISFSIFFASLTGTAVSLLPQIKSVGDFMFGNKFDTSEFTRETKVFRITSGALL